MTAELYDDAAPNTVANFEKLANDGFYDGVKFHRVIPEFVVQGGDPLSRDLPEGNPRIGTGGPGYKIDCETANNPYKHELGALSMAHAGKNTGGSQFFIVLVGYLLFQHVYSRPNGREVALLNFYSTPDLFSRTRFENTTSSTLAGRCEQNPRPT